MYRRHFGLTHCPLGKQTKELFDDGQLKRLNQRFNWLLESPGIGLLMKATIYPWTFCPHGPYCW